MELERNIFYVEKENEFEIETPDQAEAARLEKLEDKEQKKGLIRLNERQRKLALVHLDIDSPSDDCVVQTNLIQKCAAEKPDLRKIITLFEEPKVEC